jgi:hypothetical protein
MTQPPRESVDSLLRELAADDDARTGASLEVQTRLLSEVRAIGARRRRRLFTAVMLTAVAASVVGALFVSQRSVSFAPPPAVSPEPQPREMVTAFLPLPGATAPTADAYPVRLELPRTALVSLGLGQAETLVSTASATTVLADVLVGEDGLARAVRFVHQE